MPRLNKRALHLKKFQRNANGSLASLELTNNAEDWQVWEADSETAISQDSAQQKPVNQEGRDIHMALKDSGASSDGKRRGVYQKTSRTTKHRRTLERNAVKDKQKLTSFGFTLSENVTKQEPKPSSKQLEIIKITSCLDDIKKFTTPIMNIKQDGNAVNSYHHARYLSVNLYFKKRLEGLNKGEASLFAANFYWPKNSPAFRARTIIKWANEFYDNKCISKHNQGAHVKRESFFSDNDVKLEVLSMIKKMRPSERILKDIKNNIEESVIPSTLGTSGTVSLTTLSNYLYEWGYQYRNNKREIFFDGHEREDVVEYRNEWSKRMIEYMTRSDFYEGEQLQNVIEPDLQDGHKKIVFVTHDESTFYANDGKNTLWLKEGDNYIRKKGVGQSIMVSEFQCPCHGTMRSGNWTSRRLFKAGGNREGWWTYEHMVEQLREDAIKLFELLHPGCTAVFLFDNSSNHGAYPDNALVASRMPLNEQEWSTDKKKEIPI